MTTWRWKDVYTFYAAWPLMTSTFSCYGIGRQHKSSGPACMVWWCFAWFLLLHWRPAFSEMNIWTCKVIILIHAIYVYIRNIHSIWLLVRVHRWYKAQEIKGDDRGSEALTQKWQGFSERTRRYWQILVVASMEIAWIQILHWWHGDTFLGQVEAGFARRFVKLFCIFAASCLAVPFYSGIPLHDMLRSKVHQHGSYGSSTTEPS